MDLRIQKKGLLGPYQQEKLKKKKKKNLFRGWELISLIALTTKLFS